MMLGDTSCWILQYHNKIQTNDLQTIVDCELFKYYNSSQNEQTNRWSNFADMYMEIMLLLPIGGPVNHAQMGNVDTHQRE